MYVLSVQIVIGSHLPLVQGIEERVGITGELDTKKERVHKPISYNVITFLS